FKNTIQMLQYSVDNLGKKITNAESRISSIEDENHSRDLQLQHLHSRLTAAVDHIDNLENWSHRNNVRILGFLEGAEEGNPSAFLSTILPELLGLDPVAPLDIEQAHCSLGPRPPPDRRPHAFIVKLLRYTTRDKTLRATREKDSVTWRDKKISFYPDLSRDLQQRRQRFSEAHRRLQDWGIRYGMFYPATLKVTYNGIASAYSSPEDVLNFLRTLPPI
uniref:L1 transposable element RRM domain-containing protein n=1 Tax=Latimeria chalumnae TaxID=7897 RepID=H2ZV31_LATCH